LDAKLKVSLKPFQRLAGRGQSLVVSKGRAFGGFQGQSPWSPSMAAKYFLQIIISLRKQSSELFANMISTDFLDTNGIVITRGIIPRAYQSRNSRRGGSLLQSLPSFETAHWAVSKFIPLQSALRLYFAAL